MKFYFFALLSSSLFWLSILVYFDFFFNILDFLEYFRILWIIFFYGEGASLQLTVSFEICFNQNLFHNVV